MKVYRLEEASEKKIKYINRHPKLDDEQKEKIIDLYIKQNIPDNIIDWNIFNSYSFDELKSIAEDYLKGREEKKNKKNLSKAIEGRDYIKVFENTNEEGTEYLYLPLTWVGSKYLASDHFLPKIKVPSKVMQARDFSDNTAKNEDLSPGAKWCISLWTIPDLIIDNMPLRDENDKELRHEGKRYWLDYTKKGYYFLFYFRDYDNLEDISKKVAFTLNQGSFKITDITLADDTRGERDSVIGKVQEYWNSHYTKYKSQIENIKEVSEEESPKFDRYEEQKEQEAIDYYNSHIKEYTLREYFTYNESTGRYDSKGDLHRATLESLIEDGEFTVPLGVINGYFDCSDLELRTLENGPTEVTGSFYCDRNNLTSLEGAPEYVEGIFDCSYNYLTTLEGAPEYIEGDFNCFKNELLTLEYAPKKVGGYFDCSHNQLTTLEGSPKEVGGGFDCSWNELTTLEYAPKKVGGYFSCSSNKLLTLEGAPEKIGGGFICSWNQLTTLEYAPKEVEGKFDCSYNNLTTLEGAPKYVGENFYCWSNPLDSKDLSSEVKGTVYY